MIIYYKDNQTEEPDYLSIDTKTKDWQYENSRFGQRKIAVMYEGRASAIQGIPSSVCTTGINADYIKQQCKRIAKKQVPEVWLHNLIGE